MVELLALSGGYPNREAVSDVTLTFPAGKITVIAGPNGCGKSTLLKLSCGQLVPSQGAVQLNGRKLSSFSGMEIARHIAYLPQSRTVPDITVERLVLHGRFPWLGYPRVYRRQDYALMLQAMEWAGIAEARKKVFAALSGGERQRAYLAMLLAQDADTVLLDEPATYLDITYQLELIKLLNKLKNKGKAVVAVLHDLHMALDCADVLAVMQGGRLLALDTPTQILASGALEQAFGIAIRPRRYDFTLPPGDA